MNHQHLARIKVIFPMQLAHCISIIAIFSIQLLLGSDSIVEAAIHFNKHVYSIQNTPLVHIEYSDEHKIKKITYPSKTIFDKNCFVYELKNLAYSDTITVSRNGTHLFLKKSDNNIREGIIGQRVEKYGKTEDNYFYETTREIIVFQKLRPPKL